MIRDLISRYTRLVDIEHDPKIISVPKLDIFQELASEWFQTPYPSPAQRHFIMMELKKELDRQEMFNSMHEKFGTHA